MDQPYGRWLDRGWGDTEPAGAGLRLLVGSSEPWWRERPTARLLTWQGNHARVGAAEFDRAAIGAIDRIPRREATGGIFGSHLVWLDPLGLEFTVARGHQQGAGASQSLVCECRGAAGGKAQEREGEQKLVAPCHGVEPGSIGWAQSGCVWLVCTPKKPPNTMALLEGEGESLVQQLADASREFDATARDLERNCWMAVHRHIHGVLPSEYDIREVPEELYLAVLAARRQLDA